MLRKIALELLTICSICAILLLLKVVYPAPEISDMAERVPPAQTAAPERTVTGPIDLNLATAEELQQLPGIGRVIARRIVDDRQVNGYYQTIGDVLRVSGIGPKKLEKMTAYIELNWRNLIIYRGY